MNNASHREKNARASGMQPHFLYAVGIGSNRPLSRHLGPRRIVHAAMAALDLPPLQVVARAPVIATRPIGPSLRLYANSAAIIASALPPLAMLDRLQALEARFNRRRYRRWGDRTLDLDLLLWSGGRGEQPPPHCAACAAARARFRAEAARRHRAQLARSGERRNDRPTRRAPAQGQAC